MKIHIVTQKNRVYVLELDDEDYNRLIIEKKYVYYLNITKQMRIIAAFRFIKNGDTKKMRYLHHDIIGKPPIGMVTDHRDRNPLNNQKANLWHCTYRQNGHNRCDNREHPGVQELDKSYAVSIRINKIRRYLGCFKKDQYELACQIYDLVSGHEEILKDLVYKD